MKKVILGLLLFSVLLAPQVVSAAWWNPFSWNWKALFTEPESIQIEEKGEVVVEEDKEVEPLPELSEEKVGEETEKQSVTPKPVVEQKSVVSTPVMPTSPTPATPDLVFLIQNVKNEVTEDLVKITWTTSVDSQSQLLMDNGDGIGYESAGGFGNSHYITIENPTPSKEYFYKIVARNKDGKVVDYYGSFTAIREFVFSSYVNNDCRVVAIKDTAGKPAVGMSIKISGTYGSTGSVGMPWIERITDKNGEAKLEGYCDVSSFQSLKVRMDDGFETKLQIQNGTGVGAGA